MARRKVTGFTRFLLVMIILVPLAFVGAALYNGKDPLVEAKRLLGIEQTVSDNQEASDDEDPTIIESPRKSDSKSAASGDVQAQIDAMLRRIEKLERDNLELQKKLRQYDVEIKELKRQLTN
ncbi:MAG: hypothetical protein SFU99_07325 [Saprospiraceae bacterium]|nr:hypothetical protein [Saprospiraceae bacterium]